MLTENDIRASNGTWGSHLILRNIKAMRTQHGMAGFLLHAIQTDGVPMMADSSTSDFSGDVSGQLSQAVKRAASGD
jgi:hypothetical protein